MKEMKDIVINILLYTAIIGVLIFIYINIPEVSTKNNKDVKKYLDVEHQHQVLTEENTETVDCVDCCNITPFEIQDDIQTELYYDSLEYLARCVEAEAGDQSEYGKRLVIDVILNRVDSVYFPNTIEEVINQPYQFSVVGNNSINEVVPADDTYQLISQELESRENTEVLYFRMDYYHPDTIPVLQEQDHYFSK